MRTGEIIRDASIENFVHNLNLSSGDGLQTITGDDLWRQPGPQILSQAFDFFGRVVRFQAEGKISRKRAMQQTLIEFSKPSGVNGDIREYNFSHPELSDSSNIGESSHSDPWV